MGIERWEFHSYETHLTAEVLAAVRAVMFGASTCLVSSSPVPKPRPDAPLPLPSPLPAGRHVEIVVISKEFEGKSAVNRQRMVYKVGAGQWVLASARRAPCQAGR